MGGRERGRGGGGEEEGWSRQSTTVRTRSGGLKFVRGDDYTPETEIAGTRNEQVAFIVSNRVRVREREGEGERRRRCEECCGKSRQRALAKNKQPKTGKKRIVLFRGGDKTRRREQCQQRAFRCRFLQKNAQKNAPFVADFCKLFTALQKRTQTTPGRRCCHLSVVKGKKGNFYK